MAATTSPSPSTDSDPQIVRFTNQQDLIDIIESTTRDFLTVTHLSPDQFAEIQYEPDLRADRLRFRRYNAASQTLTIVVPTDLHNVLHTALYFRYFLQLILSGTEYSWKSRGPITYQSDRAGGGSGEAGSTGGPRPERVGPGSWPTLVVESGVSETLPELHEVMRWWFQASNHEVKIVLLAKYDHQQDHILLERWEEESSSPPGAITRSRAAAMVQRPVKRQSITITRDATPVSVSYNVAGGPLVLGFRLLYVRDPGPHEGDFVIDTENLEVYAERVWGEVPISDWD
ncbi:hypothetical protein B0T17DRAFT_546729 [Bombardia bombarda]|uniref:Uncharacterized protein n=1 Tax=Bombardia bombarda TaxID=252184 RepID=A0AA39U1R6_9PEZI|nr:hypothetical protein B0T17DRAFT_546729 [Bombardia bombarda]